MNPHVLISQLQQWKLMTRMARCSMRSTQAAAPSPWEAKAKALTFTILLGTSGPMPYLGLIYLPSPFAPLPSYIGGNLRRKSRKKLHWIGQNYSFALLSRRPLSTWLLLSARGESVVWKPHRLTTGIVQLCVPKGWVPGNSYQLLSFTLGMTKMRCFQPHRPLTK